MNLELREIAATAPAGDEALWTAAGSFAVADSLPSSPDAPLPAGTRRLVALRAGKPCGRVGFGRREGFTGAPGVTGYVGWYAAEDAATGVALLRAGAGQLLADGAERVVGPLDGNTWHRYRVTLPRGAGTVDGSPFLSEPRNPPGWGAEFEAAGFHSLLDYETRLVRIPRPDPEMAGRRERLAGTGVRIRPLDLTRFDDELRALHALSVEAFAAAPFYSPIELDGFVRLYAGLRPLLDPALVRLAETDSGRVLGFVFAFPDAFAPPGSPRIVLKTLAAHREARGMGLGRILVDDIHAIAAERGASVLHALMQVSNVSENISRRSGSELFRLYRLYGLEPG